MRKLRGTSDMKGQNKNNTAGVRVHNGAWLEGVLAKMRFGVAAFRVEDGWIQNNPKLKLRHSGKPGGRQVAQRDLKGRYCAVRPDAVGDFLADVEELSGIWEMTLKVTDRVPTYWEYEEADPPALPQEPLEPQ